MSVMIETENLGRNFGEIAAVRGLSFSVSKGEVLGFLGPNGAGKSTTMKLITGFLTPSFGSAKVAGFDVVEESREVRKRIGYLPENAPLYGEMEVCQFLDFVAEVRGISSRSRKERVDSVVESTSLGSVVSQRIETLSKGYKRRVGLAQALINDPEILILDEPTDGLDPNQKHEVRSLIRSMAKDKCIVLSTHILEEVDEVCTRAVIIASGQLVADATPEELKRRSRSYGNVVVRLPSDLGDDQVRSTLNAVSGVKDVQLESQGQSEKTFRIIAEPQKAVLKHTIAALDGQNWNLRDIRVDGGNLDEVFREITN